MDIELEKKLEGIAFYKQYPQMIPKVGKNYGMKKLLIVCSNFYFPTGSDCPHREKYIRYCDPDWWYKNDYKKIIENKDECDSLTWINMRDLPLYYPSGRVRPWTILLRTMIDKGIWKELYDDYENNDKAKNKVLDYCAVMNYFVRPAYQGESITPQEKDRIHSAQTFWEVVRILDPVAICMVGSQVYWNMLNSLTIPGADSFSSVYKVYKNRLIGLRQPGRGWWTRTTKSDNGINAETKFANFLNKKYPPDGNNIG